MAIIYKTDILNALKAKGYSTYFLKTKKILGEATIQKIRKKELVSWKNMSTICKLLDCQPGDLLEYIKDEPSDD